MQDNPDDRSVKLTGFKPKVPRITQQSLRDLGRMAFHHPVQLTSILFWRLLGKKLRARDRLDHAIAGLPFAHRRWVKRVGIADLRSVRESERWGKDCAIAVHLHIRTGDQPSDTRAVLRSIMSQSLSPMAIYITNEAGAELPELTAGAVTFLPGVYSSQVDGLRAAVKAVEKGNNVWIVPITSDMRLPEHAVAGYASHLIAQGTDNAAFVIYGDEDCSNFAIGKPKLWLKPEWDTRMSLSQDFVSRSCILNAAAIQTVFEQTGEMGLVNIFELVLRMSGYSGVKHIRRITAQTKLGYWREAGSSTLVAIERVLRDRAAITELRSFGTVATTFAMPDPVPSVSVIIATRDKVELLRTCVEGVLRETDYPNLELIIADNDSVEPETLEYMEMASRDPRAKIVRWPHPFNYSAINNFAARHATGDYLCLLNNDIEVLEPHWLSAMMKEAVQPGVGAVGARLLYPDRTIQHAGVAIGIGNAAGHAHRGLEEGQEGYFAQALIARGASAVTAACLVVARKHFEAVGGLDEQDLAVAYNDVDLCLKLQALGLTNIYTPEATLIHHESKSRGLDFAPEHLERYMRELKVFQERWDTTRVVDAWHHPQLDRGSEVYALP